LQKGVAKIKCKSFSKKGPYPGYGKNSSQIPGPGGKKGPDRGSGSATLVESLENEISITSDFVVNFKFLLNTYTNIKSKLWLDIRSHRISGIQVLDWPDTDRIYGKILSGTVHSYFKRCFLSIWSTFPGES
jgi:hypothetical protein